MHSLTNSGPTPDTLLVQWALMGDERAFAQLLKRYERLAYAAIQPLVRQAEVADELVHQTFTKTFRYLRSWKGQASFGTWLYQIARRTAIDHLRTTTQYAQYAITDMTDGIWQRIEDPTLNAQDRLAADERTQQLKNAMTRLRPDDRLILYLYYWEEQRLDEICNRTGWEMSNAKSRLCRARQRLRIVLGETLLA